MSPQFLCHLLPEEVPFESEQSQILVQGRCAFAVCKWIAQAIQPGENSALLRSPLIGEVRRKPRRDQLGHPKITAVQSLFQKAELENSLRSRPKKVIAAGRSQSALPSEFA